jgi:hypothetical protein
MGRPVPQELIAYIAMLKLAAMNKKGDNNVNQKPKLKMMMTR